MMQKAQVFSLESNTSVRNRLTHSLEVADIGRTLARTAGKRLEAAGVMRADDVECMQCIVESACLIHDIGNPPFGHFGEEAIKCWFTEKGRAFYGKVPGQLSLGVPDTSALSDFVNFDGNPQGFRIVTRLHNDVDEYGLNLTCAALLASIKYPNVGNADPSKPFGKKVGIFSSEESVYRDICGLCPSARFGKRYFLAYLMELADDICYCSSDISDSFEKALISSRDFKEEFRQICREENIDPELVLPKKMDTIKNFGTEVAIWVSRRLIDEATTTFTENIQEYLSGNAPELSESLPSGGILKCFKKFARRFIYTDGEVQRIEIAGSRIVEGLLDHFGRLLRIPRSEFRYFIEKGELRKGSGLDTEWRIFNQLSKRMIKAYSHAAQDVSDEDEWIARAHLVVDYISGLTDNSALRMYQNFMGISL
jgi:dGTPase